MINISKEQELEEEFSFQYRTYVSLENDLMEFMSIYKENPNNELLYVLTRIHVNCVQQLENFLSIVSHFFTGEIRRKYEEVLKEKLDFLREIAVDIREFNNMKHEGVSSK